MRADKGRGSEVESAGRSVSRGILRYAESPIAGVIVKRNRRTVGCGKQVASSPIIDDSARMNALKTIATRAGLNAGDAGNFAADINRRRDEILRETERAAAALNRTASCRKVQGAAPGEPTQKVVLHRNSAPAAADALWRVVEGVAVQMAGHSTNGKIELSRHEQRVFGALVVKTLRARTLAEIPTGFRYSSVRAMERGVGNN